MTNVYYIGTLDRLEICCPATKRILSLLHVWAHPSKSVVSREKESNEYIPKPSLPGKHMWMGEHQQKHLGVLLVTSRETSKVCLFYNNNQQLLPSGCVQSATVQLNVAGKGF